MSSHFHGKMTPTGQYGGFQYFTTKTGCFKVPLDKCKVTRHGLEHMIEAAISDIEVISGEIQRNSDSPENAEQVNMGKQQSKNRPEPAISEPKESLSSQKKIHSSLVKCDGSYTKRRDATDTTALLKWLLVIQTGILILIAVFSALQYHSIRTILSEQHSTRLSRIMPSVIKSWDLDDPKLAEAIHKVMVRTIRSDEIFNEQYEKALDTIRQYERDLEEVKKPSRENGKYTPRFYPVKPWELPSKK